MTSFLGFPPTSLEAPSVTFLNVVLGPQMLLVSICPCGPETLGELMCWLLPWAISFPALSLSVFLSSLSTPACVCVCGCVDLCFLSHHMSSFSAHLVCTFNIYIYIQNSPTSHHFRCSQATVISYRSPEIALCLFSLFNGQGNERMKNK